MEHPHEGVRVGKLQQQKILHCLPKHQLRMEDHPQKQRGLQPAQRGEEQRRLRLLLEQKAVPGGKRLLQELKELQQRRLLLADLVLCYPQMNVQMIRFILPGQMFVL